MDTFGYLSPRQRRLLDDVSHELRRGISVPDARRALEARSDDGGLRLANPDLQPVAFAVRHTTWMNYVYGVLGELFAWVVFFSLSVVLTVVSLVVFALGVFALYQLHLRGLELLRDTLPRLYDKRRRIVQRFARGRWSAQRRRHNAYKKLCADTRAPVLYLRSFSFDFVDELPVEVTKKADERLAEHYEQYGPVIAVAGPDDKGYMHGPVRLYFDDDIWRAGVVYLMSVSQRVIIQAGISQGTLWELGMARRLLEPEKLIISVADASNPNVADDFYYDFRQYAEAILGCELPKSLGSSLHLGFGPGWKAVPQDPRLLMSEKDQWVSFKAAARERMRQARERESKTPGAASHSCGHRQEKSFTWLNGWEDSAACERCGGVLKLTRPTNLERELYQKLLRKSFGDKAQAERLIEAERRKRPDARRIILMKHAIDRWERDNR